MPLAYRVGATDQPPAGEAMDVYLREMALAARSANPSEADEGAAADLYDQMVRGEAPEPEPGPAPPITELANHGWSVVSRGLIRELVTLLPPQPGVTVLPDALEPPNPFSFRIDVFRDEDLVFVHGKTGTIRCEAHGAMENDFEELWAVLEGRGGKKWDPAFVAKWRFEVRSDKNAWNAPRTLMPWRGPVSNFTLRFFDPIPDSLEDELAERIIYGVERPVIPALDAFDPARVYLASLRQEKDHGQALGDPRHDVSESRGHSDDSGRRSGPEERPEDGGPVREEGGLDAEAVDRRLEVGRGVGLRLPEIPLVNVKKKRGRPRRTG